MGTCGVVKCNPFIAPFISPFVASFTGLYMAPCIAPFIAPFIASRPLRHSNGFPGPSRVRLLSVGGPAGPRISESPMVIFRVAAARADAGQAE